MNISMYTCYALEQEFSHPVEAFRHFYNKGIHYADIVDDELASVPLHLYCEYLEESGIIPGALVSMLDIASFDSCVREKNIAISKGYIDQMEKLGMGIYMPAPSVKPAQNTDEFKKMREIMIQSYSHIADYAKGSGIKVAIENQSTLTRADSKTEDCLEILSSVPELGFIFDTGNFFCIGEDALKSYSLLRERIVHVHCKDWRITPFGQFVRENIPRFEGCVLGEGSIPVREILTFLKEDGYSGRVVLEINSPSVTLDMLNKSADFLNCEINTCGE